MPAHQTRSEHLAWARDRAHAFAGAGDLSGAVNSMVSDIGKHPDTALPDQVLGPLVVIAAEHAHAGRRDLVKRWIDGWK